MKVRNRLTLTLSCLVAACGGSTDAVLAQNPAFDVEVVADLDAPWAMTFVPDGRLLVTDMEGALSLIDPAAGSVLMVGGLPDVHTAGQAGFGDIVLHPEFARNGLVYFSYAESGSGGRSPVFS